MNKKWLLYLTGFFSGMSVMAIELGASRLLAPYFSSSQIVWTIIIGTIMIAMALGNFLGGRMADKQKTPDRLFLMIFLAAIWTMLIPLVGKFIISGVALVLATFITSNYLIWAALFSCLLVFVFPLLVLGMITPNLVKYAVSDLSENGKTVGIIEALNTVGSIIGTFLPTFVTIPNIGTSWTFVIFASILFILTIVYFVLRKKWKMATITSVFAVLTLVGGIFSNRIGIAYWNRNILYEGESIYNYLRVEETDDQIILSTNVLFGVQSVMMKNRKLTGMYYDYALAAPVMAGANDQEIDILILGLGTGTFATQCLEYFTPQSVDGVEIDAKIVELAHRFFALPEEVNTYIDDGRSFLSMNEKQYDVIMVDAYQDITIPFQMSSREFFQEVKKKLKPAGAMVVNMNMYSAREGGINDYLCGTIEKTFDSVYTVHAGSNVELFAADGFDCQAQLRQNIASITSTELQNFLGRIVDRLQPVEANDYLLTDDKAPVEWLGMQVLDEMIMDELNTIKERFKGMSIREIIELLFSGELF